MKKCFMLLAAAVMVVTAAAADYEVSGKVVAPSLENVAVCDGENFHNVKPDGTFSFRFSTDCVPFIYLSAPSDLKIDGRWSYPLKPGKNEFTFKLSKQKVPDEFTFVQLSDIQYNLVKERKELSTDLAEVDAVVKEHNAAFVAIAGDLTPFGKRANLKCLREELDRCSFTCYPSTGSHDFFYVPAGEPRLKNFTECIGAPHFGWNYGGIYFFSPVSEYKMLEKHERIRQKNWIKNALRRLPDGTPVVVDTHQAWLIPAEIEPIVKEKNLKVLALFAGHRHTNNLQFTKDGFPLLTVAPLRRHDSGTFSKNARLVRISRKSIITTDTRMVNNIRRIEANVFNGDQLFVRVLDSVHDAVKVDCTVNGRNVKLSKCNQAVWYAALPEKISSAEAEIKAVAKNASWSKKLTLKNIPQVKWAYALDNIQRRRPAPFIHKDRVYVAMDSNELPEGRGGIVALDLNSGRQLWEYRGSDIHTRVTADDDFVRAFNIRGEVIKLDAKSGREIKKHKVTLADKWLHTESYLTQIGNKLLALWFNDTGRLTALDIESGKPLWKNAIAIGGTQDVNYTVYGDKVLFNGFRVHGVAELESGKLVWQVKVPKIKRIGNALPLADGDTVCFLLRREVKKFNIADGKLIWSCKLPASGQAFGGMMLDGRKLIVNYVNRIFVIDADTGKIKAKSEMAAPSEKEGRWYQLLSNSSEPVSVGGNAVVGGDDGAIYKIDTATAKLTEIFNTGFAFKGRPFVSGNKMVIVGFDGIVYALEM